jgi:hypothetical protein
MARASTFEFLSLGVLEFNEIPGNFLLNYYRITSVGTALWLVFC